MKESFLASPLKNLLLREINKSNRIINLTPSFPLGLVTKDRLVALHHVYNPSNNRAAVTVPCTSRIITTRACFYYCILMGSYS